MMTPLDYLLLASAIAEGLIVGVLVLVGLGEIHSRLMHWWRWRKR